MAVRGRRPKPTALKKALGNPGGRPMNEHEPIPPSGALVPPAWVDGDTRGVWDRLVPIMLGMGVASIADIDAIARYCDGVVLWVRARDFLHKNGSTFPLRAREPVKRKAPDGSEVQEFPVVGVQQWPQVSEYRQLSKLLLAFESEFGLTASSRSRIEIRAPQKPASLDDEKKRRFFETGGTEGQVKTA